MKKNKKDNKVIEFPKKLTLANVNDRESFDRYIEYLMQKNKEDAKKLKRKINNGGDMNGR